MSWALQLMILYRKRGENMREQMLSVKDVMEILRVGKSKAYNIMNLEIEHLQSPLRVSERALNEWIKRNTVYPVQMCKKRRAL